MVLRRTMNIFKLFALIVIWQTFIPSVVAQNASLTFTAWSPDGIFLAVTSGSTVQIVDVATSQPTNQLSDLSEQVTASLWSPDGSRLAVANGSTLEIWQQPWDGGLASLEARLQSTAYIRSMAWNPQGNQIAIAHDAVEVWNLGTRTQIYSVYAHNGFITQISWSPDGARFATTSVDRSVKVWDAATGAILSTMTVVQNSNLPVSEIFTVATSVSWSPVNTELVFGAEDGTTRLWNTAQLTGSEVRTSENSPGVFRANEEAVLAVDWNPTGTEVAAGARDGIVSIWDTETGDQLQTFQSDLSINSVSYSPYGGRLAISGSSPLSQVDTDLSINASQFLANGAVQIVVPAPSLERLQTIADACNAPIAIEQSLTASIQADQLADVVAQVEALPENTIPPACAADLIAVAEALQSQ